MLVENLNTIEDKSQINNTVLGNVMKFKLAFYSD